MMKPIIIYGIEFILIVFLLSQMVLPLILPAHYKWFWFFRSTKAQDERAKIKEGLDKDAH